jgi:hypothetical protein
MLQNVTAQQEPRTVWWCGGGTKDEVGSRMITSRWQSLFLDSENYHVNLPTRRAGTALQINAGILPKHIESSGSLRSSSARK